MRVTGAILCCVFSSSLLATEAKVVGDQLILSGKTSGNEVVLIRDAIAEHGDRIKLVILRDLNGPYERTEMMRASGLISERGWHTAISGSCGAPCAYLFLGGVQRHFSDDKSPGQTYVVLGSTKYIQDPTRIRNMASRARDDPAAKGGYKLQEWLKARTGDRISQFMLDRLFPDEPSMRYLHFYDSKRLGRKDGASILYCDGKESSSKRWTECEKIADSDAYKEGIVTSAELIRSNDRADAKPAGSSTKQ